MSLKLLTLVIIHKDDKVLLGMKKRGFGAGKWNGFGGKVQEGESIEQAAKRELFEESGLVAHSIDKIGLMHFIWENNKEEIWEVTIFKATDFEGEPIETEEMKPQWFTIQEIPFDAMWPDDKHWFPLLLENKKFSGKFIFGDQDTILEYKLEEI